MSRILILITMFALVIIGELSPNNQICAIGIIVFAATFHIVTAIEKLKKK